MEGSRGAGERSRGEIEGGGSWEEKGGSWEEKGGSWEEKGGSWEERVRCEGEGGGWEVGAEGGAGRWQESRSGGERESPTLPALTRRASQISPIQHAKNATQHPKISTQHPQFVILNSQCSRRQPGANEPHPNCCSQHETIAHNHDVCVSPASILGSPFPPNLCSTRTGRRRLDPARPAPPSDPSRMTPPLTVFACDPDHPPTESPRHRSRGSLDRGNSKAPPAPPTHRAQRQRKARR